MSQTLVVSFSDAELRRRAEDPAAVLLRDPRHPGLRFRFTESRPRGSWYLLVRRQWRKIGAYPEQGVKAVVTALPDIRQRLLEDGKAAVSGWETVGDLLNWFADRLEPKRRATAKSAIACHLLPRVGALSIAEVSRSTLDTRLIWPMQETLSLEYVRLVFGLLVDAFRKAHGASASATLQRPGSGRGRQGCVGCRLVSCSSSWPR